MVRRVENSSLIIFSGQSKGVSVLPFDNVVEFLETILVRLGMIELG